MATKPLIRVDVAVDTVCPWCYVGKKHLDRAIDATKDLYDFQVTWHPFLLEPGASQQGISKRDFYANKFGARSEQMAEEMSKVYAELGLTYSVGGLTGSSLDSHRLIHLAGRQSSALQSALVEELFANYHTQEKYIGDRQVLLEAAQKVGVENAEEFLADSTAGSQEVREEIKKLRSKALGFRGVPYFLINGRYPLPGAAGSDNLIQIFHQAATSKAVPSFYVR